MLLCPAWTEFQTRDGGDLEKRCERQWEECSSRNANPIERFQRIGLVGFGVDFVDSSKLRTRSRKETPGRELILRSWSEL